MAWMWFHTETDIWADPLKSGSLWHLEGPVQHHNGTSQQGRSPSDPSRMPPSEPEHCPSRPCPCLNPERHLCSDLYFGFSSQFLLETFYWFLPKTITVFTGGNLIRELWEQKPTTHMHVSERVDARTTKQWNLVSSNHMTNQTKAVLIKIYLCCGGVPENDERESRLQVRSAR